MSTQHPEVEAGRVSAPRRQSENELALWERAQALYRGRRYGEALELYRSLAETGRAGGELYMLLASTYGHGIGTRRDLEVAEQWVEHAAMAGYPPGQLALYAKMTETLPPSESRVEGGEEMRDEHPA